MMAMHHTDRENSGLPLETLTPRECPICGSSDATAVFAEANYDLKMLDDFAFASRKTPEYMHYRLIRCPRCDLLYASPVPAAQGLADAYCDAAFDSGQEAAFAARTYGKLLQPILGKLSRRGAALDVGTGDGAFLLELSKAGFQTIVGLEPSTAPIADADPRVRPWIRNAIFCEGDFTRSSFSLVTCFQTLEHLPNPMEFCRGAWQLLEPGGAILFVDHNYRAAANRLMGMRSPIFDIEHMQIFSPLAMHEMLKRSGFRDISVHSIWNRYPLHYWMKLAPLPRSVKARLVGFLKAVRIGHLGISIPAGNMAAIGFK